MDLPTVKSLMVTYVILPTLLMMDRLQKEFPREYLQKYF